MMICAPVISQMAAEAAVRESWDYARSFHADLRRRRQIFTEALADVPGIHWTPSRSGIFGFARVEGCGDSEALSRTLLEQAHVVTIPGSAFGRWGEGCLRLSYGRAGEAQLAEAARRLGGVRS
jgi:aspartate/methionine/tyrosine aminotransferase